MVKGNTTLQYLCQKTSVYEPTELTVTSSRYFGYPISQAVGCYGSKIELRCPSGQLIRVHAAYYGNQLSPNYCNPAMDSVCFRAASAEQVMLTCENRTRCELVVTERVLGAPCPADIASNQLLVQYQCLDAHVLEQIVEQCVSNVEVDPICPSLRQFNPTEEMTVHEQHWCEPDTMLIECDNDTTINVICTFYGIDPTRKCENQDYADAPTTCFSKSSMLKVATYNS